MFCPNCGKDNSHELKFCASCGTNLEAVSLALSGREEDFFTKMDTGIDYFVARYSEHVFKNAPQGIAEHRVAKSWQVLGQGIVTTFVDILLFTLMWNILPFRFFLLCISTPFRLLAERGNAQPNSLPSEQGYRGPELAAGNAGLWLGDAQPSVTENTTKHLDQVSTSRKTPPPTTGRFS